MQMTYYIFHTRYYQYIILYKNAWYRLCIFHIYKIYQIFQMTFRYLWQKFDPLMNEPQCQKIFGLCSSHVLVCAPRKVKFWYLPCIFHISIIDAHKNSNIRQIFWARMCLEFRRYAIMHPMHKLCSSEQNGKQLDIKGCFSEKYINWGS